MTSGTEPLYLGGILLGGAVERAQKMVTRHSQKDLVEKEEKCEYEAFVTDSCTSGLGIAEIANRSKRRQALSQITIGRVAPEPAEPNGCSW